MKKAMSKIRIIPAILATTEKEYRDKLFRIEKSGQFADGWIQIDLMDNTFVQNKSVGPQILAKYPTTLRKEAHLMVDFPQAPALKLVKLPVERFIVPFEIKEDALNEFMSFVKVFSKAEIGFSLNPETAVDDVEGCWEDADAILVMGVHPGFGGQKFILETVGKVKETARLREQNNLHFLIGVDGGINENNAKALADAGADYLVIGEHLINGKITENLEKIRQAIGN